MARAFTLTTTPGDDAQVRPMPKTLGAASFSARMTYVAGEVPASGRSERELQERSVCGRHRDDHIGELDRHRRRAIRLEVAARSWEQRACLPVLDRLSPWAEKPCLFSPFGLLLPGFTHCASALTVTVITSTSPRPATFPETVRVFPFRLSVGLPTKCALEAATAEATIVSAAAATPRGLI